MWPQTDTSVNLTLSHFAEALKVVTRVLIGLRGPQNTNWNIVLNHFDLLEKILEICGINPDMFDTIFELLESHGRKVR